MPINIMQSILPIGKKNFDPEKTASWGISRGHVDLNKN